MARSTSKSGAKRYRVFRPRPVGGLSTLEVSPEWYNGVNRFSFDGHPVGKQWRQPDVYVPEPLQPPWDVSLLKLAIVMTPDARKKLKNHLDFYGRAIELLPLVHEDLTYTLINVTYVVNCLNREASKFRSTGTVEDYIFHPRRIDHSLFKIPEEAKGGIFVAEDSERPYWSFKWQCEQNNLVGLKWKLIWEGD